jgi:hypothetical protein
MPYEEEITSSNFPSPYHCVDMQKKKKKKLINDKKYTLPTLSQRVEKTFIWQCKIDMGKLINNIGLLSEWNDPFYRMILNIDTILLKVSYTFLTQ